MKISESQLRHIILKEVNSVLNNMLLSEGAAYNRQKAFRRTIKKYFSDIQGKDLSNEEVIQKYNWLKENIPNIRKPIETDGTEMYYWCPAVTKYYAMGLLDDAQNRNKLNQILEYLGEHPDAAKEYDGGFNQKSLSEIIQAFDNILKQVDSFSRNISSNQDYRNNKVTERYNAVKVPNFETAEQYAEYMDEDKGWCITHNEEAYDSYTFEGTGLFYFFLKEGFENVPEAAGENAPLDEYGLSMIAVGVDMEGNIVSITSRWNHENARKGLDPEKIMKPEELSKLVGFNIYSVCKPRSEKELGDKIYIWNAMKQLKSGEDISNVCTKYFRTINKNIFYVYFKELDEWYEYNSNDNYFYNKANKIIFLTPTSIIVPEGTERIKDSEFFGCEMLKNVVLPMSVKYIGEDAFERCTSLSSITIQNPNVSIGRNAFDGCPEDAKVILGGREITISDLKNKNNMKLTENQLRNLILKEAKKVLNEISNDLLANAAYGAKDKGRRVQRGVFFDRIANNLNSKYGIDEVFEFFSVGSSIFAKVYYDYDLDENFMSSFEYGELMLRDTYDNKKYTIDEFEQKFAGDYHTGERRRIMAGLRNLEDILKKANQDELEPQFNDDISDNEIRIIKGRKK